jgi:hypothetical protein
MEIEKMTGKIKAEYIEQLADRFNAAINRQLTNLKESSRPENEILLREMIGNTPINANKVVKIIYPRN